MIVNCFEGSNTSGLFKEMCIKTMQLIRDNNRLLLSHLSIFVEEGADGLTKNEIKDPFLLARCEKKLFGKEFFDEGESVEEQVKGLIQIAEDPLNYLQHYLGWCPYW